MPEKKVSSRVKELANYEKQVNKTKNHIKDLKKVEEQIAQLEQLKDPNNIKSINDANKRNKMWDKKDVVREAMQTMIDKATRNEEVDIIPKWDIDKLIEIKTLEKIELMNKINQELKQVEATRKNVEGYQDKELEKWDKMDLTAVPKKNYEQREIKNTGFVGGIKQTIAKLKLAKNITVREYKKSSIQPENEEQRRQARKKNIFKKITQSKVVAITPKVKREYSDTINAYKLERKLSKEYNKKASIIQKTVSIKDENKDKGREM